MKRVASMLLVLSLACGREEEEGKNSVEVELCEHMKEGPAVMVSAAAAPESGPDVSTEHMRFDVAFGDFEGMKGGYVVFRAGAVADYVFALDAVVPFALTKIDGSTIAIEETRNGATECTEVAVQHTVLLEVGSARIKLGPTSQTGVSIVVEPAEHGNEE